MDRESAWKFLCENISNDNLRKHCLAVEAAMRAVAMKFDQDEELWGITGLIHDLDYEKHPDPKEHSLKGAEMLKELGFPEEVVNAVRCHNPAHGLPRQTMLDKALFGVDELTGFIIAVALVRPSKKIEDVKVKSVTKKFKDKAFARQVDRDVIRQGAEELGLQLNEQVGIVLEAMKAIAPQLGL